MFVDFTAAEIKHGGAHVRGDACAHAYGAVAQDGPALSAVGAVSIKLDAHRGFTVPLK